MIKKSMFIYIYNNHQQLPSLFHPPIFFYVNRTLLEGALLFCQFVRKE